MENTNKQELLITRVFDAPREKVWRAWTEPEKIMKWWGPENFTSPVAKVNFKVGGEYLYCMRGKASPDQPVTDFWSGGKYLEIIPYEKIVCTDRFSNENGDLIDPVLFGVPEEFPKENIMTVNFYKLGNKTRLTILYETDSEAELEAMINTKMKEGWEASLEKLAQSLK